LYKLVPPRATFVQDMTEAEGKPMEEHAIYWKGLIDRGIAIVFGLVLDPKGPWGVGIVEAADEPDVHALGTVYYITRYIILYYKIIKTTLQILQS
jgi:uncharacterized protein